MVPDKDGKFTLCSDTTSSADALKLKADNAAAGEAWIEALRDAAREATRKLEEDRAAALDVEPRRGGDPRGPDAVPLALGGGELLALGDGLEAVPSPAAHSMEKSRKR